MEVHPSIGGILKDFPPPSFQVNDGKAASVAPETMKTEPDGKAKGEK